MVQTAVWKTDGDLKKETLLALSDFASISSTIRILNAVIFSTAHLFENYARKTIAFHRIKLSVAPRNLESVLRISTQSSVNTRIAYNFVV